MFPQTSNESKCQSMECQFAEAVKGAGITEKIAEKCPQPPYVRTLKRGEHNCAAPPLKKALILLLKQAK